MKTVKCKLCDHTAPDIVDHIESAHSDVSLEAYMKAHGGIDSVIHPSLQDAPKAAPTPAPAMSHDFAEIAGIKMKKIPATALNADSVPEADPAYQFQTETTKRVLMAINERRHVLLTGHTGTGKTSMIEQIAAKIGQPTLRINLNQQTTYADFIGHWTVVAGDMVWMDGALPTAMRLGMWLILDEIDYGEPNILCSLNPVLESKPKLVLKEKHNEVVQTHENFRIFGTGNTLGSMKDFRHLYQGANLMNEAWLDRWRVFKVDYMDAACEEKVLQKTVAKISPLIAKELVRIANMIRKAFIQEEVSCTFSTRRLIDWTAATVSELSMSEKGQGGNSPLKAAEYTIFNKISKEDAEIIDGVIRRVIQK